MRNAAPGAFAQCTLQHKVQCQIFLHRQLAPAHGLNQPFHLIQVTFQRVPPGGAEAIHRFGQPAFKVLLAHDVFGFLELARVDAQVAVRGGEQFLQVVEAERLIRRQGADDSQAHALVNQAVEVRRAGRGRLPALPLGNAVRSSSFQRVTPAEEMRSSHRTSLQ